MIEDNLAEVKMPSWQSVVQSLSYRRGYQDRGTLIFKVDAQERQLESISWAEHRNKWQHKWLLKEASEMTKLLLLEVWMSATVSPGLAGSSSVYFRYW